MARSKDSSKNPYGLKQHPVDDPYGVGYDNTNVRNVRQHPVDDPYGVGYDSKDPYKTKLHPPKLIFRGDEEAGQLYVRPGKIEMEKTVAHAMQLNAPQYSRTTLLDKQTGAYVITNIHGNFQSITIVVPSIPSEEEIIAAAEEEEIIERPDIIGVGIYSGFAYENSIENDYVDGPPPLGGFQWIDRLHEFNPTEPCRAAYPDDFLPGLDYQPITRLALEHEYSIQNRSASASGYRYGFNAASTIEGDVAQTNLVHPCAYSGPMARIVSLALGNGNFNIFDADTRELLLDSHTHDWWVTTIRNYGFKIGYDFHFDRVHGAMKDNKNNWWIIEISQFHGIVARRLPMIEFSFLPEDPEELKAVNEFGGIPTGESFPDSTSEINFQVSEGNFIRLMNTDELQTEFWDDEVSYAQAYNWCFNNVGNEARITTYNYKHANNWMQNVYWKLNFTITTNDQGESSGSAILTKIREDILADGRKLRLSGSTTNSKFSHFPIYHYRNEYAKTFAFYMATAGFTDHWDDIPDGNPGEVVMDFPVWVGWIDGEWHEINYRMCKIVEWEKGFFTAKLYPVSEADGDRKKSINYIGKMAVTPASPSNPSDPEWVLVSSHAPGFNLGEPTVDDGQTHNGTVIDVNEEDGQWTDVTTHRGAGSSTTDIYKIKEVRSIFFHTETWNSPNQAIDFVTVPYNRNAYFIRNYYNRPAKKQQYAMQRTVYMYGNRWTIRNSDFGTYFLTPFTSAPPRESYSPGAEYNYAAGDPPDFMHHYPPGHGAEVIGGACDDPPEDPPSIWYVSSTRGITTTGTTDAWGAAEDIYTHYSNFNTGWIPSPACGPIDRPDNDSSWREDLSPQQGTAARADGVHETSIEEESQSWWLVADRMPTASGETPFVIGTVDYEDDYITTPTSRVFICQAATLGKKGFIYSDVSQMIYDVPAGWPYLFVPMEYEGIMPEVKEDGFENYERRWLTFVGVNNL